MTELPIRYLNIEEEDIDDLRAAAANLTIARATRPLPGQELSCFDNAFYVSGQMKHFGTTWEALDASEVKLVSNRQILDEVIAKAKANGHEAKLPRVLHEDGQAAVRDLASSWFSMPYLFVDDAAWQQLLTDVGYPAE